MSLLNYKPHSITEWDVTAATAGHFYEWVSMFSEKCPRDVSRGILSMIVAPKWFHNSFLCLYMSRTWQSISWNNLHEKHNGCQSQIPGQR